MSDDSKGLRAGYSYINEFDYLEEEEDDFDEEVVIIRKKKRGRPKSDKSRNQRFEVRMTDQELASLNDMTVRYDISRSDLVRKALMVYDHIMKRH